jgi:hypothetical protein
MTITDPEDAVRALLAEAPPSAAMTQQGRDRLLALATEARTASTASTAGTAGTIAGTVPATPRRGRRRRALTIGLPATAAAAAVTAFALVAASSGTGAGPAQPGTAHAGGQSTSGTSVKAKLLAAIGAAAGQMLYVHSTETVAGESYSENIWLSPWGAQAGQTQRMRLESPGDQDVEMIYTMPAGGGTGGALTTKGKGGVEGRLIDVETRLRTWSDQARTTVTTGSPVESPAQLRQEIASGQLKVMAHTELAGQPVLELRHTFDSPPGSGPWTRTLWVSARTYLPVRALSTFTEGTKAKGFTSDIIAVSYKFLPATSANLALLKPVIPAGFTQTAKPPSYPHG